MDEKCVTSLVGFPDKTNKTATRYENRVPDSDCLIVFCALCVPFLMALSSGVMRD